MNDPVTLEEFLLTVAPVLRGVISEIVQMNIGTAKATLEQLAPVFEHHYNTMKAVPKPDITDHECCQICEQREQGKV